MLSRMNKDKEFLKANNLMDYSLLLIFFKKPDNISYEESESHSSFCSNELPKTPEMMPGNNQQNYFKNP